MKKGYILDAGIVIAALFLAAISLLDIASSVARIKNDQRTLGVETRYLTLLNRYISSADCLAYEQVITKKEKGTDFYTTNTEIKPAVLDMRKILDVNHRECITQDELYTLEEGESLHYDVYIKDYNTGKEYFYWNPSYIQTHIQDKFKHDNCYVDGNSEYKTYNFLCDLKYNINIENVIDYILLVPSYLTPGLGVFYFLTNLFSTPSTKLLDVDDNTFSSQLIGGLKFMPFYYNIKWKSNFTQSNLLLGDYSKFDLSKEELDIYPLDCYFSDIKHVYNVPVRILAYDDLGNKEYHYGFMKIRFCAIKTGDKI